jgi:lipopolysaccharide biosynthesis glycosyltransferase
MHIALNFTDNYWAPAFAVMRSICLTTMRRSDLVFHLCHSQLKPCRAAFLERIVEEFGATVVHHDPENNEAFRALIAELPTDDRYPSIIYARLVLDKLLPTDAERVIYLDCDVMVMQPIELLYDLDMQGKPLAAVHDSKHLGINTGRDMKRNRRLQDTGYPYFNSGVVLIDLKKFGAVNILEQISNIKRERESARIFFDQDLLNYIFRDAWLALDWRFNVMEPKPIHEMMQPAIIHYTGGQYPWQVKADVAFHRLYRHVMTTDLYYRYLAERWPTWLAPLVDRARKHTLSRPDW